MISAAYEAMIFAADEVMTSAADNVMSLSAADNVMSLPAANVFRRKLNIFQLTTVIQTLLVFDGYFLLVAEL